MCTAVHTYVRVRMYISVEPYYCMFWLSITKTSTLKIMSNAYICDIGLSVLN